MLILNDTLLINFSFSLITNINKNWIIRVSLADVTHGDLQHVTGAIIN
jgi:hypothetical protein